jgi:hypothetical protein
VATPAPAPVPTPATSPAALEPSSGGSAAPEPGRSATEGREPTFSNQDLVASMPPLAEWSLADFSGTRIVDAAGNGIGTVEGVVADSAGALYLVTALDSHDVDGEERLIPIGAVTVDPPRQSLAVDEATVAMLPQMASLGSVASAFTLVDSDQRLRELMLPLAAQ